jgi:ribonuclease HI
VGLRQGNRGGTATTTEFTTTLGCTQGELATERKHVNSNAKRILKKSSQRNVEALRTAKQQQEHQRCEQAAAKAAAATRRRAQKRRNRAAQRTAATAAQTVVIAVDGSYCHISSIGAWAVTRNGQETITRTGPAASSYHCELLALLEGLRSVPTGSAADITSDCAGVVSGFQRIHDIAVLRRPTSARMIYADTWELVIFELQRLNNNVAVRWDRAHTANSLTRGADIAARALLRSTRTLQAA